MALLFSDQTHPDRPMAYPIADVPWLHFEMHSVFPYYLPGLLWTRSIRACNVTPLNNIIVQSRYLGHLWSFYHGKFKLTSPLAPLYSFIGDPDFPPAFQHRDGVARWSSKGLTTFGSKLARTLNHSPNSKPNTIYLHLSMIDISKYNIFISIDTIVPHSEHSIWTHLWTHFQR